MQQLGTDSGGRLHKFQLSSVHYEITREDHPDFSNIVYQQDGNGNHVRKTQGGVNVYYGIDVHNKLLWVNQATNAAPTTGQANPYRKYTYNGNGEPTSIEHRDTTGSPVVIETLEWDGMGKLRKVTSGGTVVYTALDDGAGDRVQATQSGATHTYSYGAGLLYDSVGSTTYTPGVSHRQAGIDSYYHEDWIGSNRYTTDATGLATQAGQRWDAFGNLTASAGSHGGNLRWVGGHGYEADGPLGMSVLGARNYDPSVGRFLSADPIGIAGGINQFAYSEGDPVNGVDPSGFDREDAVRALKQYRGKILQLSYALGIQPELLAGAVWVENYAGGVVPGLHQANDFGSRQLFIHGAKTSLGIASVQQDPWMIPGCRTEEGRKNYLKSFFSTQDAQLVPAIDVLKNLINRPNRYPNRSNKLTGQEMAIILTEYNRGPTTSSAAKAKPSSYGEKFLEALPNIKELLYRGKALPIRLAPTALQMGSPIGVSGLR